MLSPLFTEVKLRGMGQAFPGINPSGNAFMYQAATVSPAAPLQPTPAAPPGPASSAAPGGPAAVAPLAPAPSDGSVGSNKIPASYYLGAIVIVAFGFSLILPSSK